tara:strand:+ start:1217 stop:2128 length:912 start_codon:yes stop_codon:yes gene_type:complete
MNSYYETRQKNYSREDVINDLDWWKRDSVIKEKYITWLKKTNTSWQQLLNKKFYDHPIRDSRDILWIHGISTTASSDYISLRRHDVLPIYMYVLHSEDHEVVEKFMTFKADFDSYKFYSNEYDKLSSTYSDITKVYIKKKELFNKLKNQLLNYKIKPYEDKVNKLSKEIETYKLEIEKPREHTSVSRVSSLEKLIFSAQDEIDYLNKKFDIINLRVRLENHYERNSHAINYSLIEIENKLFDLCKEFEKEILTLSEEIIKDHRKLNDDFCYDDTHVSSEDKILSKLDLLIKLLATFVDRTQRD